MAVIYFFSGYYKAIGPDCRSGEVLHSILGNVLWTRWSFADLPLPLPVTKALMWFVLIWELMFPVMVAMRPFRNVTLCLGVILHIGLAACLQLGMFSFYMLCFYLPLVPWERFTKRVSSPQSVVN